MCGIFELTCYVREWVIEPAVDNTLKSISEYAMNAFKASMISYGAAWTNIPTVSFHATEGGSGFVFKHLHYWQMFAAIIAVMFGGVKVALSRNGAKDFTELLYMFARLIVTNGAIVAIVSTLVTISDLTAAWIVQSVALDGSLDFSKMFIINPSASLSPASSVIMFLMIGLVGFIVNMFQIGILLVRSAMLVLLTGFIPITAAVSNLEWGKDWFNKSIAWLFAFLLYKPVAALIYGFGITVLGNPTNNALDTFTSMAMGIVVLLMGVFALPALIKFLTPAVASMGGGAGGGGGMGFAMLAAGAFANRGGASANAAPPSGATSSPNLSSPYSVPSGGGSVQNTTSNMPRPGAIGDSGGGSVAGASASGASSAARGAAATAGAATTAGATEIASRVVSGIEQVSKSVNGVVDDAPGGAK